MAKKRKDKGGAKSHAPQERPRYVLRPRTGMDRNWDVMDLDDDPTLPVMTGDYTVCQNFITDMQFLLRHGAEIALLNEGDFESVRTEEGAKLLRDDLDAAAGSNGSNRDAFVGLMDDYEDYPLWNKDGGQMVASPPVQPPAASVTLAAPKPMDPVLKLALEKATTGFFVGLPDGGFEAMEKPVNIVLSGDGVFEIRRYPIGYSVVQASKERIPGLDGGVLNEGFTSILPKIPYSILSDIVAFFRHVDAKHKSEALVQVFYDPETGLYETHVPLQDISGGRVEHAGAFDPEGRLIHVMDCHSHHTMDGYFSSTDDADESRFNGRLFGVIGKIRNRVPKMLWRVRVAGKFIGLPISDIFELEQEAQTVMVTLGELLQGTASEDGTMGFTMTTPDVFEEATFPEDWLDELITSRTDERWKLIPGNKSFITVADTAARDYKTHQQERGWWATGGGWQGWGGRPVSDSSKTQKAGFYKGSYFIVKQGTGELFQLLKNNQLAKVRLVGMTVRPADWKA